jgi:hypothetical protein
MMTVYDWTKRLRPLYDQALELYQAGQQDPRHYFTRAETDLLASVGARPGELYDFAEDFPEIDWDTALLIMAVRRDYFRVIQKGQWSAQVRELDTFPARDAELRGMPWLPRVIVKARCRLRGELPASLMYGCGGDRHFFRQHDVHPADFLRVVWAAGEDDEKIAAYVCGQR